MPFNFDPAVSEVNFESLGSASAVERSEELRDNSPAISARERIFGGGVCGEKINTPFPCKGRELYEVMMFLRYWWIVKAQKIRLRLCGKVQAMCSVEIAPNLSILGYIKKLTVAKLQRCGLLVRHLHYAILLPVC